MSELKRAISNDTVDSLKSKYLTYFGVKSKKNLKAELVNSIAEGLTDQAILKTYLGKLSALEMALLQESLFNYGGLIDRGRFKLKYGDFPNKPQSNSWYYRQEPSDAVMVFFFTVGSDWYNIRKMPEPVMASLKQLVAKPEPDTLTTVALPEPLPNHHILFERERLALSELHSIQLLLQDKQIKVSEKTGIASGATLKKVSSVVHEYYSGDECDDAKGCESMLAYGWLRLLGNSKFTKQSGTTLIPAKKTDRNPADTIREMWAQWLNNKKEDEFRRIDRIKGQTGKGKRYFTDVLKRREVITAYLKECEVNAWIAFADFANFMFITGADLEVTTALHHLYIYNPDDGCIDGRSWDYLEVRYLRCFLLEYAATLGLVDVVMAPPNDDESFYDQYGDMECLSRYDGLRYFRLTPLGQYALGLTDHYKADHTESTETPLTIQRQGRIAFDREPTPWEQRFLSLYADHHKDHTWKLSRKRMMETLQIGGSVDELKAFLQARDDQPFLPEDCESILKQAAANVGGVEIKEEALIVNCKTQDIVEFIINDKVLSKWCQRLGKQQIVIPKSKEKKFKESLNSVGIGCV
ncbi:hypothetical protein J7438_20400 [Thalassotalea sp. G20_0]|uniref:hypothetical protein n=1 Tax=Thalassotalea sp. G20_0 TaxID=2821093 RepID=UPI001ADD265A|nr:hypothetical protein [Thalassotalea sp. G20_0]MBO9496423.1 hypothetical protein [Thalassotalea sp. G20_0]